MGNWIIRWNFNKPTYTLGEQPIVSFWLENTGDTYLYLSNLELNFDFGIYNLENIGGMVSPRENKFLGNISLSLPINVVGRQIFTFRYFMREYINNNWIDLGFYQSDKQYFISVYPTPFYKVFVSRGLTVEDRAIGDSIAELIREWGFETVTVGIEVKVPEEQVSIQTREEIRRADGAIAIATPRFMDALTGLWRTFEWLHNEVGIAFGIDKPLLILTDRRVMLGGLPSYLVSCNRALSLDFDPYSLKEIRASLSTVMPGFREWIETGRRQNFFDSLGRVVVGGLAVAGAIAIVSGIIGALSGGSKK
jgi:hypothetical protein